MFPRLLPVTFLSAAALLAAPAASHAALKISHVSDYLEVLGTDAPETVVIEPEGGNLIFSSPQGLTVQPNADLQCGPSSTTVVCSASGIGAIGVLTYGGADSITENLVEPGDPLRRIDVFSGPGADTINGGSAGDIIYAEEDGDTINGRGGNDSLHGEEGADTVTGDVGEDFIAGDDDNDVLSGGADADRLFGGDGSDTLAAGAGHDTVEGGSGNDGTVDGGPDIDRVDYDDGRSTGVAVDLSTTLGYDGDPGEDAVGFEYVTGGGGPDVLTGTAGANKMDGAGGNDVVNGMGGTDELSGSAGDDLLQGGAGEDHLLGFGDDDTLDGGADDDVEHGHEGNDRFVADPAADLLVGGPGADTADYSARTLPVTVTVDALPVHNDGGTADDTDGLGPLTKRDRLSETEIVRGSTQADTLTIADATPGALHGGPGGDTLTGGSGIDQLFGEAGADTLSGGSAADELSGGSDDDVFQIKDGHKDAVDCGDGGADSVPARDQSDTLTACEDDPLGAAAAKAIADKAAADAAAKADQEARRQAAVADQEARRQAAIAADEARRRASSTPPPVARGGASSTLPVAGGFSQWKFTRSGRAGGAKVARMRLTGLSPAARVTLTCEPRRPGACPLKRSKPLVADARGQLDLAGLLKGRTLPARTSLLVQITEPGKVGRAMRWTVRAGKASYSEFTFTRSV